MIFKTTLQIYSSPRFLQTGTAQRAFQKRLDNPFIFIWAVLCVLGVPNSSHFSEYEQ